MRSQILKKRDIYLKKLIAFQDMEPIKVITGIRRCGKSSLLKLMIGHLLDTGVKPEQIVEMNFESHDFRNMSSEEVYQYVKSRAVTGKRLYLFLDEMQRIPGWEIAVNSFRVDLDCDIYVTGSNSYLLSSEYSTYLSGRYVEIKMLPLSFREFLTFRNLEVLRESVPGRPRYRITDSDGNLYDPRSMFDVFLRLGGMPGVAEVGFDEGKAMAILEGIYSTVVVRDILERGKRTGDRHITNSSLLRKITLFLADNIGNPVSLSRIGNTLDNEGLLQDKGRTERPSTHTVQFYVASLIESYFFYEAKRFDIKGRELLRTLAKYYIVDLGLRNLLLGFRDRDRGHILENVVYLELLRRGFDVAVGRIGDQEIDFIAKTPTEKLYIQVTESMTGEHVRERELAPLQRIRDNYPKVVLALDSGMETNHEGIETIDLIDWLLSS